MRGEHRSDRGPAAVETNTARGVRDGGSNDVSGRRRRDPASGRCDGRRWLLPLEEGRDAVGRPLGFPSSSFFFAPLLGG